MDISPQVRLVTLLQFLTCMDGYTHHMKNNIIYLIVLFMLIAVGMHFHEERQLKEFREAQQTIIDLTDF